MSKDLNTLIRVHQYRVDEKRRVLGDLLGEVASLEQKNEYLEYQIIAEQKIANSAPESAGMYYGAYAKEAVNKRKAIQEEISDFERKISEAQEDMRIEYKNLKTFEITQESRDQIIALETTKTEQAILDELGQETHRRRRD